jgi:DNA replication protein DnaC
MRVLPKRFDDAKPSDWEQGTVIRQVTDKYFKNFGDYFLEGKSPSFFGTSGKGKSRAAASILRTAEAITNPAISTGWYPASETMNRLLDFRDLRMNEHYNDLWHDLKNQDLIVMDDITTLRNSPRVLDYFWMIVEARYYNKKSTIYTGNFEGKEDIWVAIEKWFTPALSRRIYETSSGLTVLI